MNPNLKLPLLLLVSTLLISSSLVAAGTLDNAPIAPPVPICAPNTNLPNANAPGGSTAPMEPNYLGMGLALGLGIGLPTVLVISIGLYARHLKRRGYFDRSREDRTVKEDRSIVIL